MLYLMISCADCDAEFKRPASTLEDMKAAYQFAKGTGWTTEGRYVDYCPDCSAEPTMPKLTYFQEMKGWNAQVLAGQAKGHTLQD